MWVRLLAANQVYPSSTELKPKVTASRVGRMLPAFMVLVCTVGPWLRTAITSQGGAETVVQADGSEIHVILPDEKMDLSSGELLNWVNAAAHAVAHYYGRFPVPLVLRIRAGRGDDVGRGLTFGKVGSAHTIVTVGRQAGIDALKNDWVMTHEMVHLAFPNVPPQQHWIEEGIATYVEPVARAQVGQLSAAYVWKQFILDMPKGEPGPGDRGLDRTPTWGRTYWGGAMFCLLADVRIRERTHNRKGLQYALRAILHHGGNITADWNIEKAFGIGDEATGVDVLRSLYHQMRDKPVRVDLTGLWGRLGVALNDGQVKFNDRAVDAPIRHAILSQ